ncbi:unnamed protein product, partial [Rotaria sp. Silwood1]
SSGICDQAISTNIGSFRTTIRETNDHQQLDTINEDIQWVNNQSQQQHHKRRSNGLRHQIISEDSMDIISESHESSISGAGIDIGTSASALLQQQSTATNSITEEIQNLKRYVGTSAKQIEEQQKTINYLQKRLDNIESKSLLRDIQIDAYEVVRLFQFYYVNKVIRKKTLHLTGWIRFTNEWCKIETEVIRLLKVDKKEVFTDQVQNHSMVAQLLNKN